MATQGSENIYIYMYIYTHMHAIGTRKRTKQTEKGSEMRVQCKLLVLLSVYACVRADICRHIPVRDTTAISEATDLRCATFLRDSNIPTRYFDDTAEDGNVFLDCLVLKRDRLAMTPGANHNCSCPAGYYDHDFAIENGVYAEVSSHFLHTHVFCDARCSVHFQQVMQSGSKAKCACQNARGCRFMQRNVGLALQAMRPAELGQSLLIVPDNLLLRVGLLHCAQTHCAPPTPISPRAELLCAAHGIDFERCSSCNAAACQQIGVQCEQQSVAPYTCVQRCAAGYFSSEPVESAGLRCRKCIECKADEFETQQCSQTRHTKCHPCANGFYLPASQHDKTTCMPCPRGQHSIQGTAACVQHSSASASGTHTAAILAPCLAGREWDVTTQECSSCLPSWYTNVSADISGACVQCPPNEHSAPSGGARCAPCPLAMVRSTTDDDCRVCGHGMFAHTNAAGARMCAACPPHHVNPGGFGACLLCTGTAYANWNATACVACPRHQHRNASGGCEYCAQNHELSADGTCVSCSTRSPWELCAVGADFPHECTQQQHPSWSDAPCMCGCHKCALTGLALPLHATLDVARCRIQCEGRLRLQGLTLASAECVDPPTTLGEGFVFNPTNSSDLEEYSCRDDVLLPQAAARLNTVHHLTVCSSPQASLKSRTEQQQQCIDADLATQPECANVGVVSTPAAKALHELAISPHHVAAAYRDSPALQDCFFCCMQDYQFEAHISRAVYSCVPMPPMCNSGTVATVQYTQK